MKDAKRKEDQEENALETLKIFNSKFFRRSRKKKSRISLGFP